MLGFNHGIKLISAIFREAPTHSQQYRRPYHSHVNDSHINHIAQVTNMGQVIVPTALASISSQILIPSSQVEAPVNIINGWTEKRFRFIIELLVSETNQSRVRKVLTGYTSHLGVAMITKSLDPMMTLHLNSIITITDTIMNGQMSSVVRENDQLLSGVWDTGNNSQRDYTLRPEDVVRGMGSGGLVNQFGSADMVLDYGSTFANGVNRSNRQNTLPSAYLSNVLNAGMQAEGLAEQDGIQHMDVMAANASGIAMERTIHGDPILASLARLSHAFTHYGAVTFSEMCNEVRGLEETARVYVNSDSKHSMLVQSNDSEDWIKMTPEAIIGTQLAQMIPSIMFDNFLALAAFTMTNHTADGSVHITPFNDVQLLTYVDGVDVVDRFRRMTSRLMHEVIPGISHGNTLPFYIEVICDPFSNIQMQININGYPVPYTQPCFSDSLTSSLMTKNSMILPTMSKDFNNILSNIALMATEASKPKQQIFTGNTSLW